MAALLVSVVVTLAAGFAVSTAQWIRADRHAAREAELREKESALREQARRDLYTSDMLAVQQAWEAGHVKRMGDLLSRHKPEPGQKDWRGFEWDVFWRHYQRAQPIRTFQISDTAWVFSVTPDGRTLAVLVYVHAPNQVDERVEHNPLGCCNRRGSPGPLRDRRRPSGMPSPFHRMAASSPREVSLRRKGISDG